MLEEQLAFQTYDNKFTHIVHFDNNQPYLAKEMCEFYHQKKLKKNSDNVEKSTKSEFKRGHRKQMFTEEQKKEIAYLYANNNMSKSELGRKFKCSEKTIRNILKDKAV